MANKPSIIKLGSNEVDLRFDMEAILVLDEQHKINVYAPATYGDFSPAKLRALVWAGQLYRKDALSLREVGKLLPVNSEEFVDIAKALVVAINNAIDSKAKE